MLNSDFLKTLFNSLKGSDSDYLLIITYKGYVGYVQTWDRIPSVDYENIQEAIDYFFKLDHLDHAIVSLEFYDLYAEFYKALIRKVTR